MSAEPEALASRAIRGGAVLMAARIGMLAFSWTVTLIMPRLVGTRGYGVMTWGFVFLYLAEIFAEAGLGRALVQKEDARPEDRDRVFTLSLTLTAALYLGLFVSAGPLADYVGLPEFALFLRVLGMAIWLVPFRTVALAVLDREQKLGRLAAAHVVTSALQAVLVLGLGLAGAGYWALTVGALTGNLIEAVALVVASGWRPRLAWPGPESRSLMWFGVTAAGGTLLWFVYDNADFAIVGRLFGPETLGRYSLAFMLMTLPVQKLTGNVNQVAYPVFCRLQNDRARLSAWFLRVTVMLGFVGAPALVGMALVADDAIGLVYGPDWEAAVLPFRVLAAVGVVRLYAATLPPLFNAVGRPDIVLWYTAACLLMLPPALLVGGLAGGLGGVCLAWLIVYPLVVAGLIVRTRAETGFGLIDFLRPQAPIFGGCVVMAGVVLLLRSMMTPGWERLTASALAGAATYAGVMLLAGRGGVLADVRGLWAELRGG